MKTLKRANSWSDANPGKTLLAILVVFALACAVLPADPPYVGVIAGVVR